MPIVPQSQARPIRGMFVFVAVLILAVALLRAVGLITEWLWFQEVEYQTVFIVTLLAKIKTGALFGAGICILLAANLLIALRLSRNPLYEAQPGVGPFGIPTTLLEPSRRSTTTGRRRRTSRPCPR